MSTNTDGTTDTGVAEAEGTEGSPEAEATNQPDPVALARKRQAGAEAARQQAEKEAAELRKRLETFESANRSAEDQKVADNAALQERLAAAEKRAADAEAKANAKILDTLYPNARKELPEVTDEVRLAKFEALLADSPEAAEPPPPQNPNEQNRTASGDTTAQPKEETSEDILARLKAGGKPDWL